MPNPTDGRRFHRVIYESIGRTARVDELPFGTRGGIRGPQHVPVDGDYDVKLEVAGAGHKAHELQSPSTASARVTAVSSAGVAPAELEFQIPVKAGVRLVGITFMSRTSARRRSSPGCRARGARPALVSAVVGGPYNVGNAVARHHAHFRVPAGAGRRGHHDEQSAGVH